MSKQNLLTAIWAFVVAWLVLPLFVPLALSAALLAGVLIMIVLVVRSLDRADGLWIIGGFVIGVLVSLLVPSLAVTAVAGHAAIWSAVGGLLFAQQV